jgi:RNA-directed DNA polymerase
MSRSKETKAPLETTSEDWTLLPWRKLERHVYRLQKRIFRAAERGNDQAVHRLQQLLMRSRSAQLLAVRRVTQDNQGKKTAGIDGVKALPPEERLHLAEALHPKHLKRVKAQPVRRVWIPKPGKPEKRPLGIPVMRDRAHQALVKLALEPEWEARFEPNSYGFRPGRSSHDAIEAIFLVIRNKAKYVLDADIRGCFDHIAHQPLLDKLATYPAMRQTIRGWLKAGIMEADRLYSVSEGTPQGGVISPLLANVALHGMETALQSAYTEREGKPFLVRYADDFVVFHPTQAGAEKARHLVETWLATIGLELKPSKTRMTHTLNGEAGFSFLGFQVRQYPVGETHTGHTADGAPIGHKTLIKPDPEAVKRHMAVLRQLVRVHRNASQDALVNALNPVIIGWARYYRTVVSCDVFTRCDHLLNEMLQRWAYSRHSRKHKRWVVGKYWAVDKGEGWKFKAPDGTVLLEHHTIAIQRHVKVKGTVSPYDGNLVYWSQRLREHPLVGTRTGKLLKLQQGRCAFCGLFFKPGDALECDHILPRQWGGKDWLYNLQVLHRHCHDQKHRLAGNTATWSETSLLDGPGIDDNDPLTEEPGAEKSARPVLERGRRR